MSRAKRYGAIIAALTVTALAGGVAAQYTSDTSSSPQRIGTGTVGLALKGAGPTNWTDDVTNLAAGDLVHRFVDLRNSGTLDLSGITVAQKNTIGITAPLFISLDACSVAWNTSTGVCSGQQSTVLVDTDVHAWTGAVSFVISGIFWLKLRDLSKNQI